ncbi:MAG: hypothetical protein HUJ75_01205, partial [Parasporobacterium sp.]|nr:hypothetical protein [Parasporobacterium sp.]
ITWAPIIPYLPAKGTPLAEEGGPGSLVLCHKEISIMRLSMPHIRITAQQPGKDLTKGLASDDGNLAALNAGADTLFCDLLTEDKIRSFSVIDNRVTLGLEHITDMARLGEMNLKI